MNEVLAHVNISRSRYGLGPIQEIPLREKPIIQSVPRDQWPAWTNALAQFAKPEDKGIGDVAARMIGAENSEAFKNWYKATTGKSCGCNGRQKLWNQKYPLNLKAT